VKYLSFRSDGRDRFGFTEGGDVYELGSAPTLIAFLAQPPDAIRAAIDSARARGPSRPLAGTSFLPVIPVPGKIVCLGLNYAEHAREGGFTVPDYPALFLRVTSSRGGAGEPILRPRASASLDYEAELAGVIGRRG